MSDGLLAVIVVLLLINLVRLSGIRSRLDLLSLLDGKLSALLEKSGAEFDAFSEVLPEVAEAIRGGRKMEAIKRYRAATGRGLKESKGYVEEIQRRWGTDR